MTFNFTATLTSIADCHPGDTITMAASIAANTAADAGAYNIAFMLQVLGSDGVTWSALSPSIEPIVGSAALTTTPQPFSAGCQVPALGKYRAVAIVMDAGWHWQNVTQTSVPFNVVAAPIPVAKLNMVVGNDAGGVSQPITVQALDATGAPVSNAPIAWSTTVGSLSAASTTTDANGKSQVTYTYPSPMKQAVIVASAGSATLVMPF